MIIEKRVDALRRGGLIVKTVSVTGEKDVAGVHDIPVTADELFEESDFSNALMMVLPGGTPGTNNYTENDFRND